MIDIASAEYKGDYRIAVAFSDGASGVVDFAKDFEFRGVFEPLKKREAFERFDVSPLPYRVIFWPDYNLDLAPEYLYKKITGHYPDYVEEES